MTVRVLTGITTTGTPHLGNYAGAIRPAIASASRRSRAKDANAGGIALLGVGMAVAAGRLPAMNAPRAAMGFSSFVAGPGGRPR